jgi:hypothetical protein
MCDDLKTIFEKVSDFFGPRVPATLRRVWFETDRPSFAQAKTLLHAASSFADERLMAVFVKFRDEVAR